MKVDLNSVVDMTQFMMHEHIINGEVCYLIQPQHIGAKFTQKNKIFRSSLWNSAGELISAGFYKFPNLGENPENFPVPTNLRNSVITNKLDGSLLICSKYKGQYILRTRGTSDATKFDNGTELEIFKKKFLPLIDKFCNCADTWEVSFLFEWLTAVTDKTIVLKYENVPDWIFIGVVSHLNYSLFTQELLDEIAKSTGFKRPEQFKFNTVDELVNQVTAWKNVEGVVLYTNNGQTLHKIKSDDYKKKHAFKSNATLENTIDLFVSFGYPNFNDFQQKIGELYDWECAQMCVGHMSNICDAWKQVNQIEEGMKKFIFSIKDLPTRKLQAERIISSYGGEKNSHSGMLFHLLNGNSLTSEMYKKLLFQVISK
jgi:hypothetical protein